MSIKILFGLGNSGAEYANTRHNVGAMALEQIAQARGVQFLKNKFCGAMLAKVDSNGRQFYLAFCDGFMNNSGVGIKKVLSFLKISSLAEVAVVYDDITLPVGRFKISVGGSSGGHNGVNDIMSRLGNDFARIKIGIGAKPFKTMDLADYVLGKLSDEDASSIKSLNIGECVDTLVAQGVEKAQNLFNRT